jgi:hypothetical protein
MKHGMDQERRVNRRSIVLHLCRSIVAQRIGFVNLAYPGILWLSIITCVSLGLFCCDGARAQEDDPTSDLYRQALDKLGPESRIQWLEPGSLSLKRWDPGRSIELRGVLVEWEPTRLVLLRKDAKGPTTFPGDQVIGVEPGWKEESFASVHRHFSEQRFAEVIAEGQSVLKTSSVPRWQQRLIVAEMVQSACALGQWQVAGKVYGYLAQDTSPQVLLSVIPLPWSDELLSAGKGMREPAAEWLQRSEPEMQLLGASWLVGSEQNGLALEMLKRLSNHESPLVSNYAQVQLWRSVPPSEIESAYFGKWVALRDSMPWVLQAGPTMLLGHRLEQSGAWELAVSEWLRIASLYGDRYHLKARAIDRAIAACRTAGAIEQADRIGTRFPRGPDKSLKKTNR